MLKENHTSE